MEITVNIKAPDIVEAINNLAKAINGVEVFTPEQYEVIEPNTRQDEATAPVQPVQQVVPNVTTPTANAAQNATQPPQNAPVVTQPVQQTVQPMQPPVQQSVPVIDAAYRTRVQNAAGHLVEQGKMPELLALLGSFGVDSITTLSAEQFPDFVNKLISMGAVI